MYFQTHGNFEQHKAVIDYILAQRFRIFRRSMMQSALAIGRMYPLSAQSSTAKEKWYFKEVFLVFVL